MIGGVLAGRATGVIVRWRVPSPAPFPVSENNSKIVRLVIEIIPGFIE
jgi:hypothetical protein